MSVGVSLPHFAPPSNNGGQTRFFSFCACVDISEEKKTGCTIMLTLKKIVYIYSRKFFFLSAMRVIAVTLVNTRMALRLLIFSPALKPWGPPMLQGLCSQPASFWTTSDFVPRFEVFAPP